MEQQRGSSARESSREGADDGIAIRDFEPAQDADRVDALWDRVFGVARGGQTVGWLFRDGPAGESPRAVAEAAGDVVAHAGGMALRFWAGGEEIRGAYSVGAMTDPAWQGRRLFFRVGTHLYQRIEREGFAFVAGFSNQHSHRLMTGPLGRTAIRPFPLALKPLRPIGLGLAVLRRALGRAEQADAGAPSPAGAAAAGPLREGAFLVREVGPEEPALDALWARARAEVGIGAVRDRAYAIWRYGTRPDAGYRCWLAERDGRACAWAASRFFPMGGFPAGFVLDLVVPPDEEQAGRALLRSLAGTARAQGALLMAALRPGRGAARRSLDREGYWGVPEALHPQLIRFSVRGFGRWAASNLLTDPRAWCLSWGDTDVI